nr:hypothetical protein [Tanacetum cinerariifolium]
MPCGATTLTNMLWSGGALLWRRGVLLLMLTNKGWVDGNGSNPGSGFGKPGGGRETHGGGDGLEGPGGGATWVGVGDSLGDDEEVVKEFSHLVVLHFRMRG